MNASFKLIYTTYFRKVYSICLLILNNPHLAEDATQETFLKAYRNIDKLQDLKKFEAWIKVIATNTAIDIYNSNKNTINFDPTETKKSLEYFINQYDPPINDPFIDIERAELSRDIREAVSKLNTALKQLIILKYYMELKDPEIAEALNMPLGTVKSNLYKTRKILSRSLPSINKEFLFFGKGANYNG